MEKSVVEAVKEVGVRVVQAFRQLRGHADHFFEARVSEWREESLAQCRLLVDVKWHQESVLEGRVVE